MNDSLIGKRFGRLVVATEMERRHSGRHVGAECDCGISRYVLLKDLLNGRQRSCGCLAKQVSYLLRQYDSNGEPKYGCGIEYRAWSNAGQKVNNVNAPGYPSNGAKGIKLCAEWDSDFPKFFEQMGPCPVGHCFIFGSIPTPTSLSRIVAGVPRASAV